MRAVFAILLLLCPAGARAQGAPPAAARADVLDDIKTQLAPFSALRGSFRQVKTIKILKRPLRSSGEFLLAKDQGALWRTLKPSVSTVKVTSSEVAQIKDGKVGFRMGVEDQPALRMVTKVLFAVFAADVDELKRHFDITGESKAGRWQAELKPKEPLVAKVIPLIRMRGSKVLDAIQISEANGDLTAIDFAGVELDAKLRADESALFGVESHAAN